MAKKKETAEAEPAGKYNGYTLANPDKLHRAIFGSVGDEGKAVGGVGEEASAAEILAEYDKLGGLILKGKHKVKTGCFFDFETMKPVAKPKAILVFKDLRGRKVEIEDGEEVPVEVQAAEKIREEDLEETREKAEKADKKKAAVKAKGKKKAAAEDEEGEEEEELSGEEVEEDVE